MSSANMHQAPRSPQHFFVTDVMLENFGAFTGRQVGPFVSGLNVVCGKNESGKSTTAAALRDTLFGWRRGGKGRNAYRPANGERSVWLQFANEAGERARVHRARNADGLQGDSWLADDVDEATYDTLFALDADELRGLDDASTLTARLLTAASGTDDSPASVSEALDVRLKACTSRAAQYPDSLKNLAAEREKARARVAAAQAEASRCLQEERELHGLQREREELTAALASLNTDIDRCTRQEALREERAAQRAELQRQRDALTAEHQAACAATAEAQARVPAALAPLCALDESEIRSIRRGVEDKRVERHALARRAEDARKAFEKAQLRHEALEETSQFQETVDHQRRTHRLQGVMAFLVPVLCLISGIPLTLFGLEGGSLAITFFGVAFLVAAPLALVGALFMLRRPDKSDQVVSQRRKDAAYVVQQERERAEGAETALSQFDDGTVSYLAHHGLAAAAGNLDEARALLDEVATYRTRLDDLRKREEELVARRTVLDEALAALPSADAPAGSPARARHAAMPSVSVTAADRAESQERLNQLNLRIGQLSQRLPEERGRKAFAQAKQDLEEVETRLAESARSYAVLLLARHHLDQAIQAWERDSQPEVYRLASSLFAEMTEGAWRSVRLLPEGTLEVVAQDGRALDPSLLSLGTCQQLYLSLRIALLLMAERVGCNVPVLADDILVNFDAARRRSACRALLRLAASRQVILFTSSRETAELFAQMDPDANLVML